MMRSLLAYGSEKELDTNARSYRPSFGATWVAES
jgi:hypothetical protein